MKSCEEYNSIQGEGRFLGVPSRFIRTTGCNLRCAWKNPDGSITTCDTPFTSWNAENGYELDLESTLMELEKTRIKHIVITGGEPTLQKDLDEICEKFIMGEYQVTLETNGIVYRDLPSIFVSISPKLRSSYAGSGHELRLHTKNNRFIDPLKNWIKSNDYQLKFVVNEKGDIEEILTILEQIGTSPDKVYLMSQGITRKQFKEKKEFITEYCEIYGFKYSPRLHIDLWGDIRKK